MKFLEEKIIEKIEQRPQDHFPWAGRQVCGDLLTLSDRDFLSKNNRVVPGVVRS